MKKIMAAIILIAFPLVAFAEITVTLDGGFSGISSNSVIDIDHDSASVWLGTGSGPAVSRDNGVTWTTYGKDTLPSDEVSALAVNNHAVWVATSHSQVAQGESFPFGNGISLTRDGGQTWTNFAPEQASYFGKLAYDLALYNSLVYASCFYGGLIRSTDWGTTWTNQFPTQLDSVNSDSVDYYTSSYNSFSNRMFAVKTDTLAFPDTFSVWAGSANGIYRFFYTTDFADDFSHGLKKWNAFGVPIPLTMDTTMIHGRTGIFDSKGDSACNSGIISKKIFGGPGGFNMKTDIYVEVTDTLGCYDEAGIGMPKDVNPGWVNDCSDSAFNAYGIYFSLSYIGDACPDPRVPPQARHHAWFNARFLDENDSIEVFDPYSDSSAGAYTNFWSTLIVNVDANRNISFSVYSEVDSAAHVIWAPSTPLDTSMMSGRNIVLGFRSASDTTIAAGQAYHDNVSGNQIGPRVYPTNPDLIAHYYFSLSDTTVDDSLKLPGNHIVALAINKVGSAKTIWAACRPVASGEELRDAFSTDDGKTWHVANIISPSGDNSVEGWDFTFDGTTAYAATSFGLYKSATPYDTWTKISSFVDAQNETFYQPDAPFYSADMANGVIWAGGTDGAVRSILDDGWRVIRSDIRANEHFAYPSPFSPTLSTRKGTTIHFKPASSTTASVKIYDFNLELVKTLASGLPRTGGVESDDIVWDGTNDKGALVANGVYFYRIELGTGEDLWGKVVVIK